MINDGKLTAELASEMLGYPITGLSPAKKKPRQEEEAVADVPAAQVEKNDEDDDDSDGDAMTADGAAAEQAPINMNPNTFLENR